jgi:hypothetical protein
MVTTNVLAYSPLSCAVLEDVWQGLHEPEKFLSIEKHPMNLPMESTVALAAHNRK